MDDSSQNRIKNFVFIASAVVVVVFGVIMAIRLFARPADAGTVGTIKIEDCLQLEGSITGQSCRVGKVVLRVVN